MHMCSYACRHVSTNACYHSIYKQDRFEWTVIKLKTWLTSTGVCKVNLMICWLKMEKKKPVNVNDFASVLCILLLLVHNIKDGPESCIIAFTNCCQVLLFPNILTLTWNLEKSYLCCYSTHGIIQLDGEEGRSSQFILSAFLPLPTASKIKHN